MQFLDKDGWPVQIFEKSPLLNFIRLIFYTRKIKRGTFSIATWLDETSGITEGKIN